MYRRTSSDSGEYRRQRHCYVYVLFSFEAALYYITARIPRSKAIEGLFSNPPEADGNRNDQSTDVLLDIRLRAGNPSHPPCGWSLTRLAQGKKMFFTLARLKN
jgi:hypothetical protein